MGEIYFQKHFKIVSRRDTEVQKTRKDKEAEETDEEGRRVLISDSSGRTVFEFSKYMISGLNLFFL
jgi:hypothetical protein